MVSYPSVNQILVPILFVMADRDIMQIIAIFRDLCCQVLKVCIKGGQSVTYLAFLVDITKFSSYREGNQHDIQYIFYLSRSELFFVFVEKKIGRMNEPLQITSIPNGMPYTNLRYVFGDAIARSQRFCGLFIIMESCELLINRV